MNMCESNKVKFCEECGQDFCPECRYQDMNRDWDKACFGCFELISGYVGNKIKDRDAVIMKLRLENERLRREIQGLTMNLLH